MYQSGDLRKFANLLRKEGVDIRKDGDAFLFPIGTHKFVTLRQLTRNKGSLRHTILLLFSGRHHYIGWEDVTSKWDYYKDFIIDNVIYE